MLHGADDEQFQPQRCERFAAEMRAGGSQVDIIAYPGAVHQWDGGMERRLIGRKLNGCRLRVERDGTGRDDAVRAMSNRDFGAFLARVFRADP
jgi:dienelactone hydrolase